MLSRVGAAILALTAVFVLIVAAVLPWWDGPPSFGGKPQERFNVSIGLLGGEGCKLQSEEGRTVCEPLPLGGGFVATGYLELAAMGTLVIAGIALALLSLRDRKARRTFAKIVMAAAGASAIIAAALLIQGPDVKTKASFEITLPHNVPALALLLLGTVLALAAGVLALRPATPLRPRTARPVWATNATAPPAAGAQQQPVDLLALIQDNTPRPTVSEPKLPDRQSSPAIGTAPTVPQPARPSSPPARPSSPPARPSSPSSPPPLFPNAPQLKPLYEVPGAAFVPPAPPPVPARAPASAAAAAVPAPSAALDPARHKVLPPPIRGKPVTAPPISRPLSIGLAQTEPQLPAMGNDKPPPPPPPVPPPSPPIPPLFGSRALPSATDKTLGPVAVPPPPTRPSAPPGRLESEGLERQKQFSTEKPTVARRPPPTVRTHSAFEDKPTNALPTGFNITTPTGEPGDDTDVAIVPIHAGESFSTEFPTSLDPQAVAEAEGGRNRDKQGPAATDRDLPVVPAPGESPVDPHAQTLGPVPIVQANLLAAPRPRITQPSIKVPISTAPESLPPPSAKQTAINGPQPACPQCESPMAWVEEHLRFYCKSCKMYF